MFTNQYVGEIKMSKHRLIKLHLIVKKTKWSLFGTRQRLSRAKCSKLNVDGNHLDPFTEYMYPGVFR